MCSIYDFVKAQRDSYRSDTATITDGLEFSQHETLRTIELYDNDRFLSGNKDSLLREKPFFNIVSFRNNVATRATDLDTKDVQIQADLARPRRATPKAFCSISRTATGCARSTSRSSSTAWARRAPSTAAS